MDLIASRLWVQFHILLYEIPLVSLYLFGFLPVFNHLHHQAGGGSELRLMERRPALLDRRRSRFIKDGRCSRHSVCVYVADAHIRESHEQTGVPERGSFTSRGLMMTDELERSVWLWQDNNRRSARVHIHQD